MDPAAIVMACAALLTATGGVVVPLVVSRRANKNKVLDQILQQLKDLKAQSENINAKQNRALKNITRAHLRELHGKIMDENDLSSDSWADFYDCCGAYIDLGGNGEAKTMKADVDEKRMLLIKNANIRRV